MRIADSTGPMHGVQPIANAAPVSSAPVNDALPGFQWMPYSRPNTRDAKPISARPIRIIRKPPISSSDRR